MTARNECKRITETTLKSLKPRAKPWFIKDTSQRGFQIKVLPSGNASYFVEARMSGTGKVKRYKIGNVDDVRLEEARNQAREALLLIRSGTDPLIQKRAKAHEGMTVEELLETYLSSPRAKNFKARTIQDYRHHVKKHFKQWKKKRVCDLTSHEIYDWYSKGHKTPTGTDNAFRHLNALMNYAVGLEVIEINPCDLIVKRKDRYIRKPRTRHLESEQDLGKFLKAFIEYDFQKDSQKTARDLILLMLTTGLRFDEARTIKFENVDLEKRQIFIPDTKNRRDHLVPLVPLTYTMFKRRLKNKKKEDSDYVFRIKGGKTQSPYITDIRKTLYGVCDSAGIQRVSAHDLRRTFASTLNNVGVGFVDLKALMNHKDKDVSIMYVQNNQERLRGYLKEVVRYYDLKISFPERIDQGWSDTGVNVIQSAIYGNIEPDFDPINPQDYDPDHEKDLERDYWEGFDVN